MYDSCEQSVLEVLFRKVADICLRKNCKDGNNVKQLQIVCKIKYSQQIILNILGNITQA